MLMSDSQFIIFAFCEWKMQRNAPKGIATYIKKIQVINQGTESISI